MAKLKLPSFEGGSLLQKTLLYVATFVLGSVSFVAIASFIVVSAAKAVIPARNTESSAAPTPDKVAELIPTGAGKPMGKRGRPTKVKTPPVEEEAPAAVEAH